LVVLDACRFDRFQKLAPEYLDVQTERVAANADNTFGYLRTCWDGSYDVQYVTGAAPVTTQEFDFSDEDLQADGLVFEGKELQRMYQGFVPADHISDIVEVWRDSWDESLGVCPPEPVTDRAIALAPQSPRLVVHYFQPHEPYIGETKLLGSVEDGADHLEGGAIGRDIWERIKSGEISDAQLKQAYDDNLRRVLAEVALFIDQVEDKYNRIAIMGDHGEALGEYGLYTHSITHPHVRMIPWAEINGVVEDAIPNRSVSAEFDEQKDDSSVEERLQDLGYL
jgi:hypothetical protein